MKLGSIPVKIHPRPAASVIPPLSMVNVVGLRPPPILFWPSESWPIVPDCPPEAVSPNEHERGDRAATPRTRESPTRGNIITIVFYLKRQAGFRFRCSKGNGKKKIERLLIYLHG
jgi:hypothetical protein